MSSFRTVFVALLLVAVATAFAPVHQGRSVPQAETTALQFGFLKDLGLEKPDWLPDFGDKKEEDVAPAAEAEADADAEGDAAEAVEE